MGIGLFITAQLLSGQKLYFSNIPRLNTKSYYNKVIGENAGGIYILRFRDPDLKGGFSIERYSHNMDFIESENLELGKREELVKVFTVDSGLVFIKYSADKESGSLSLLRTGFSVRSALGVSMLYQSATMEKGMDIIQADYDIQRRRIGIWVEEMSGNSDQEFVYLQSDINGNVLEKKRVNTGFNYRIATLGKSCISNDGIAVMVFSVVRDEKRETDPSRTEHFMISTAGSGDMELFGLGDHKFFLSSFEVTVNEFNKQFIISGLFDYKKPDAGHGVVTWFYSPGKGFPEGNFVPFDRKFVNLLIGARREQDGADPENFKVRKLIPRDDGGMLMICEFFEITQQMETFYLNGIPQTSSKNVYNYNDLLFISMDSTGKTEWRHKVNKRQNSFASMAYLQSVGVYVCEGNVNLVYNDNSNQSNRVMHIKLTRDGVMKQKIILNSDNEYTAIIPLEGKQTGYNRFVTPVMQSRQTMLLQLVDDN